MWRALAEWVVALFGTVREVQQLRASIRELEQRVRDAEEVIRRVAQEAKHSRELDAVEREKLILQVENSLKSAARPGSSPRKK